jgi:hypothetical protein
VLLLLLLLLPGSHESVRWGGTRVKGHLLLAMARLAMYSLTARQAASAAQQVPSSKLMRFSAF